MMVARDTRLTIRFAPDEYNAVRERARGNVATWARERLLDRQSPAVERQSSNDEVTAGRQSQLRADFAFLFSFFQKNAACLDITAEERQAIAGILGRVKQL